MSKCISRNSTMTSKIAHCPIFDVINSQSISVSLHGGPIAEPRLHPRLY
jgi:hypothetical protein